ncbi:formate dehydrogenase accessory sulfurtransferase FdhD [Deltaproteobacteria bacterium]|nr:formate dehydrogenase accessory sulfurtransferase FdhD [Deltaproteobacteria bacterium]
MKTTNEKPIAIPDTETDEQFNVIRCYRGSCYTRRLDLVGEEPLLIRIDDLPYSAVMRTPGDEIFHAAGFCLGEGIIDDIDDFTTIGFCEDMDPNVVDIALKPERRKKVSALLERKGFISQTSCGICGKEMIEDMCQILEPVTDKTKISIDKALESIERLSQNQLLYNKTRGSHAAMLLDSEFEMLSLAEDVGRHNALDKAIGKLIMTKKITDLRIGILSSRISYEMVQKANRANISILLSASRPTALAVNLGKSLNMTLVCTPVNSELVIFSGQERIIR